MNLRKFDSSANYFPIMSTYQSNLADNHGTSADTQSNNEETGCWGSNIVDIQNRINFCARHYEGEAGVTLKKGLNEYLGPSNAGNVSSIHELYNLNNTSNNNLVPTYVPHTSNSTIKVLSDISNNYIKRNNVYKPSYNCSGKFWNQCPIKLQEKQNSVVVNISNASSETNPRESSWTRTAYECGSISRSSVLYQNSCKASEKPINVHILKRNWNISDSMGNNFNSSKDRNCFVGNINDTRNSINGQKNILHRNNKYLSHVVSTSGLQPFKSYPQQHSGQMNYNRILGGNCSATTVQKQNVLQVTAHQEKTNHEHSENAKVIFNNSLLVNTGSASASTLPRNVECYPRDSEDLLLADKTINESKENDENYATTSEMAQSFNVPVLGDNSKAVLRTLSMFSVVQKKLKWSCSCCGESLATKLSLTTHIKSHLLPWCRECLKVTNSIEQLQSHMEKKHPSVMKIDDLETQFVTSKYGRRRKVYSPATLLPKRRFDTKK